jgi:hypothetical protein
MNKALSISGLILVVISAVLFLIVFSGGEIAGFVVTGNNQIANFLAFFFVVIFLPLGSGLAFYGLAYRRPLLAAGATQQVAYKSGGWALGLAALIIAIILGGTAIGISILNYNSNSSLDSSVNGKIASLGTQFASVNATPGVVGIKIQWCLQQVMQDRFCPGNIIVDQGDIVQVLFIQNDTADHTFTLLSQSSGVGYDFQINDSGAGQLDFLDNYLPVAGNCSNTGTYAQMSAGVSGVYCVSGTSLLSNATLTSNSAYIFSIAQNPAPGLPFTPGNLTVGGEPPGVTLTNPGPILIPVNDQANMLALTIGPINASFPAVGVNAGGSSESQGIGAFWATQPGIYEFFCHYHVANGMFGYLIVLPNAYCNTHASACGLRSS